MANYGYNPDVNIVSGTSLSHPARHYIDDLSRIRDQVKTSLEHTRRIQKEYADRKRQEEPDYQIGDRVLLSSENIRTTRPTRKSSEKLLGPFEVIAKIGKVAYKLSLPQEMSRIHPVFHVSQLEPVTPSIIPGRSVDPPGPLDLEEPDVFAVDAIVDSRIHRQKLQYRVHWSGYEGQPDEYTWEPAENILNMTDDLDEFHGRYPDKPSPSSL